ncbi:MAG: phosphate regulon transcriptional regulatory protein PhoB [Gammaproteobacteria bacterium]|nr:phosphate regulon transcriptional regulatory protein PhoB [Gammaproteobacteria bacterium]
MTEPRILIVEDEAAIRDMVACALSRAGFRVEEAGDASEARVRIADARPDLVLVDWMLPGASGMDLVRRLRREEPTADMPIIMLTARGEEDDRVKGLDGGADDYVTKPFSPRELVARIQAVLRRRGPHAGEEALAADGLVLDPAGHRVVADGEAVAISPTEFRLLHFFMGNAERVYTRGQLLDRVWGTNVYIEERTVDVHIRRLRKALAPHGYDRFIQTVRATGYRFSSQP